MSLDYLTLRNFRNYTRRSFDFTPGITLIVGVNTAGKTNILEAISFLSLGKSMRGHKAADIVQIGHETGSLAGITDETKLEVILTTGTVLGEPAQSKKFMVNGIARRSLDFVGNLKSALFEPEDLELVSASPLKRRNFLDDVLIQVDRSYRLSLALYDRALRHRNRLLRRMKERNLPAVRQGSLDLDYWDKLLIDHGVVITGAREKFVTFLNNQAADLGNFSIQYDKSTVTAERFETYHTAERESGVTLIGPQRDDLILFKKQGEENRPLAIYGSRGEQRMGVLWLKMGELAFLSQESMARPILLLDDIFSELDEAHVNLILKTMGKQQTIITTAHKELIDKKYLKAMTVIELG